MKTVKELIFFSSGSADDASTWSNIPYLFSRELERQGIVVHKVDLRNKYAAAFWEHCVRRPLKLLMRPFRYDPIYFGYSRWNHWLAEKRIKTAVRRFPDSDYCFFIGYQHANSYSSIPSLLLSDWTTDVTISLKKLSPKTYKACILRERDAMQKASFVVSIFQLQAEKMQRELPDARIRFLGGNVINSFYEKELIPEKLIDKKCSSRRVLFIGRKTSYLGGALMLVDAVCELHKRDQRIELDVVGIAAEDFPQVLPSYIRCHGFLHKDKESEKDLYYQLLQNAAVLVNATPKWAAYSSTIEAMFFYTPVVVSPYLEFQNEFGKSIPFGFYNHQYSVEGLASDIEKVLSSHDYEKMCMAAHEAVQSYTWEEYVHKILALIEE